jgi:hypothetical protein
LAVFVRFKAAADTVTGAAVEATLLVEFAVVEELPFRFADVRTFIKADSEGVTELIPASS